MLKCFLSTDDIFENNAVAAPQESAAPSTGPGLIKEKYKVGKTIGTGGFAVVKLGRHKEENKDYAIKIMGLPPGDTPDSKLEREDIFKEITLLSSIDHPHVINLKEYFVEGNKVYLVTELLTGGELLDAVLDRGTYSEADARACFLQLLKGIEYLHSKNIVHRDLKLENLILAQKGDLTNIKIADFGLAKRAAEAALQSVCGTPQYVAPEVITTTREDAYTAAVDMWSAGIVLFILLGGYPPFYDESEMVLFEKIRNGQFDFNKSVWDNVSKDAKDLILSLLQVDPTKRPSATQAIADKWFAASVSNSDISGAKLNGFGRKHKSWRAAVATVQAMQRMSSLVGKEGGFISASDVKESATKTSDYVVFPKT
ncbi:hypothetical protein CYMTET_36083 [Cymbomonas tetramitiformis]|uniref:Protein kinase domain-containing protein n=1 Tax=Cymbomonas tetramitiformis TaxID=36881 RepID=A0AAE0F7Y3_9CHLO|nr:hypothetical protein CYMTET_36083 [Cymbomonas tetramitiformis]